MSAVPPAATPEHLTAPLRRAGAVARGAVGDVTVETARDTPISRLTRLRLTYDGDAPAGPWE